MTDDPTPRRTRPRFTLPERDQVDTPDATYEALVYGPPAPKGARRTRKFSLPDHHHQEVVGDRIEAFLDGPPRRRRTGSKRATRRRPITFEGLSEFRDGLRRETARQARYGHPTAVAILVVTTDGRTLGAADAADRRLVEIVSREARETDRATRAAVGRVMVLMPETGEEEALHLVARIERAFRVAMEELPAPGEVHTDIAMPRRGSDPLEALALADRRLAETLGLEPTASIA